MMKAIQKSSENTNTKTKTMTKTKTQKKCLKHPTYAIFLKSWWLTHSKYDDRYLTLVILFTPVTLVSLFRSYNQFYRAECITVSGFFPIILVIFWFELKPYIFRLSWFPWTTYAAEVFISRWCWGRLGTKKGAQNFPFHLPTQPPLLLNKQTALS